MKIDVEGAELDVCQGAEKLLSTSVLGLWIEVQFWQRFQATPVFHEAHSYLDNLGFLLFDLVPQARVWRAKGVPAGRPVPGRGQLIDANALYFRNLLGEIDTVSNADCSKYRIMVLKQASLAEVYDYADFAIELLRVGAKKGLLTNEETGTMINLLAHPDTPHNLRFEGLRAVARKIIPTHLRSLLRRLLLKSF